MIPVCFIPDCGRPSIARDLCNRHYKQVAAHGQVRWDYDRFYRRVHLTASGCELWLGATTLAGYGSFFADGRVRYAHRWVYEFWRGPIPDGLHIDHLCRVRNCVAVSHLEAVTQAENNRRAVAVRCAA